jgi:hypothetical protein
MVMKFVSSEDFETRRQASIYIYETCFTSSFTSLQMFIACRGLPVLVYFLEHTDNSFLQLHEIIFFGIDGILQVFNIPLSSCKTPKNDFCRIFTKSKIMFHLPKVLYNLILSNQEKNEVILGLYEEYFKKISTIIQLFSASDTIVKLHLSSKDSLICKFKIN